jgi:hypothetical protein
MKKKIGMNRRNWALLSGGGLAAALIWVVVGCFNPTMPNAADVPADVPSVDGPSSDTPSGDGAPGITWEEFTVTLRIGGGRTRRCGARHRGH